VRRLGIVITVIFLLVSIVLACGAAAPATGVVILHGKGGAPSIPDLSDLSAKLRKAGFIVAAPEMPYSRGRGYDKTYDEAMTEVDKAVDGLRAAGASTIVIAGHSLGANVALYYGATRKVDAIVALAPGHRPEAKATREQLASSVEKARKMIEEGQGNKIAVFDDTNQGKVFIVRASAAVYLSWFDPEGKAVMRRSAAALRPGTALLWVIGTRDPLLAGGPAYAFDRAPKEPHNAYVVIEADHSGTPAQAADRVVEWVRGLGEARAPE
jgi:dienelactone hydrolase